MTDASRDSSYSSKNERTTSQNSEFEDYAVVTIKRVESAPCNQSALENREGQELIRSESHANITNLRIESNENTGESIRQHNIAHAISETEVRISIDGTDTAPNAQIVTQNKTRGHVRRVPTRSRSATSVAKEKRRNSGLRPNCICHVISISLSVMSICAVGYMYAAKDHTVQYVSTEPPHLPQKPAHTSALQDPATTRVVGRFALDQNAFKQSNRTQIRWKAVGSADSSITASRDDSCLTVPERGTYGVFSVLSFDILKKDTVRKLAHFLRLEGYQEGEQSFHRKVFGVPVPENRNNPEMMSSSLVSFVDMEANGRICIYTPDTRIRYLFVSSLDNSVNIFKV